MGPFSDASADMFNRSRIDEAVSYFDFEEAFTPFDPTELSMTVLPPSTERTDVPAACWDIWSTLQQLEDELAIVRNEIACLDEHDAVAVERRIAARSMGFPAFVDVVPFLPFDGTRPAGPPADLARTQDSIDREASKARLVSDVVHKEPARKTTSTKDAQRGKPKLDTGNTSSKQKSNKARSNKPIAFAPADWSGTFERLKGLREIALNEINCYKGAGARTAGMLTNVDTAGTRRSMSRPVLGLTVDLPRQAGVTPSCRTDDPATTLHNVKTEDPAECAKEKSHSLHGAYGHQLRPVRD
jgi:hypothetical protein